MTNHYAVYTDASFSSKYQLAVSGFCILNDSEAHDASITDLSQIHTVQFQEKNNIRAELRGALMALEAAEVESQAHDKALLTLYTDCQTISRLLQRRKKLESCEYRSNRKKELLANADLYKAFFLIHDRLRPTIFLVKGHSPSQNQTIPQKNLSWIDKAVRKKLRAE